MSYTQPAEAPEPLTISLKFGHALVIIGARIGIVLLQILFAIWVALTPGLDRNL